MFDTIQYLTDRKIDFLLSGSNVGRDHVNIKCLWCDDPSEHLGIHKITGGFNCWICGRKGKITEIIKEIESKGVIDFNFIFNKYGDYKQIKSEDVYSGVDITKGLTLSYESSKSLFLPLLEQWLRQRKFDMSDIKKWGCYLPDNIKHFFSYRIVIPIVENGKEVCFFGRDMTGKAKDRYKASPNGSTLKKYQDCIYNFDEMKSKHGVIIVEGPTDVWRLSKQNCCRNYAVVGTFGKTLTTSQIDLLSSRIKDMIEIVICFDAGSKQETNNTFLSLMNYSDNFSIVDLNKDDDPDEACKAGYFEHNFSKRRRIY
jgi:hypothetical protein